MTSTEPAYPIDPGVRIGHVYLKVADLERALRFYCGVLGFEVTQRDGAQAAFVSAGDVSFDLRVLYRRGRVAGPPVGRCCRDHRRPCSTPPDRGGRPTPHVRVATRTGIEPY